MEEMKKEKDKYCKDQWAAIRLIKAKGKLTYDTEKLFTLAEVKILLKWKKIKASGTKKRDLIDAYRAAPKPPIQVIWKRSEQAGLNALKSQEIPLESTALGVTTKKMVNHLQNSMGNLDKESIDQLAAILQARREMDNLNAL
jgi:hypothetical protein